MDNDLTLILAASTKMRLLFYLGREMSKKGLALCYSLVIASHAEKEHRQTAAITPLLSYYLSRCGSP